MAVAAFFGLHGAPLNWDGITVYPGSSEDQMAQDVLPGHYARHQADLLITLMDAWVLEPKALEGMNVAHWLPVDCAPLGHMDRRVLDGAGATPIAMSRHGQKMLEDAGYVPFYVPHGIDCSVFTPLPDREAARAELGFSDRFVIGMNAANQDPIRKGYGEQFAAFAAFAKRHPDALMLVHSRTQTRQGCELNRIAEDLGIAGQVVFGDQYMIAAGLVGPQQMASWNGVLDVLSNCSYGEGFGLPVLEAQACGTPVVVTDFSAMSELCGAGWAVKGQPWFNRGHSSWWCAPSIPAITAAYEKAYKHAGGLREKARDFALQYDADTVLTTHWKPALAELEAAFVA